MCYLSNLSMAILLVQLVRVTAACPTCPSHGGLSNLSKSRPLTQVNGYLSGLLVNDCLSKSRLLVNDLLVNGHFPNQGCSSVARPLVQGWLSNNDCLSKSRLPVQVKATSKWPLVQGKCQT